MQTATDAPFRIPICSPSTAVLAQQDGHSGHLDDPMVCFHLSLYTWTWRELRNRCRIPHSLVSPFSHWCIHQFLLTVSLNYLTIIRVQQSIPNPTFYKKTTWYMQLDPFCNLWKYSGSCCDSRLHSTIHLKLGIKNLCRCLPQCYIWYRRPLGNSSADHYRPFSVSSIW